MYEKILMCAGCVLVTGFCACAPRAAKVTEVGPSPSIEEPASIASAPNVGPLKIVESPGSASTFEYSVVSRSSGEAIELRADIAQQVRDALTPMALGDRAVVVYDHENKLDAYDVDTGEVVELMELDPRADVLDYAWRSRSGARVAVIQRVEERVSLDVFDVSELASPQKLVTRELDPPPLIRCYSRCSVSLAEFIDDGVFQYLVSGSAEDPMDPDAAPEYVKVALGSQPK